MIIRTFPLDGLDQEIVFPAEEAAEPMDTPSTCIRFESKERSKFVPVTSVSPLEEMLTAMFIPESPALPEPFPADKLALKDCA